MNWFTFMILQNTVYFTLSLVYKCLKRPILCKKDRQFSKLMIQNVVKKDSPYILIYICIYFHLTGKTGFKVLLILKNVETPTLAKSCFKNVQKFWPLSQLLCLQKYYWKKQQEPIFTVYLAGDGIVSNRRSKSLS